MVEYIGETNSAVTIDGTPKLKLLFLLWTLDTFRTLILRLFIHLLFAVIFEFIVATVGDEPAKANTEREENLPSGLYPHLETNKLKDNNNNNNNNYNSKNSNNNNKLKSYLNPFPSWAKIFELLQYTYTNKLKHNENNNNNNSNNKSLFSWTYMKQRFITTVKMYLSSTARKKVIVLGRYLWAVFAPSYL